MPLALDLEARLFPADESDAPTRRGFSVRRLASSPIDVRVFFGERSALQSDGGQRMLARLASDPLVERTERQGSNLAIRLHAEYVDALADWLSSHDGREPLNAEIALGRRYRVNFLNPNATKPLHVGHLRNTTIGGALAASLRAGGANVVTQCYVCDIGRNVCEALAGWERFHRDDDPTSLGVPSDQFVGRCYAEYVRLLGATNPNAATNDPIAAEVELAGDRADELVREWMAGDPATRAAWQRIRDWALDGQRATLERLGVRFDRVFLESASFAAVQRIVDAGTAAGWLTREANGAVLYPAQRKEYAALALVRPDGFPTEHARVLGLFLDEARDAQELDEWIVVCGDEWSTAGDVALEIARRMDAGALCDRVRVVAHGMVTLQGSKMKSRDGKALLIDEFLDRLADSERVRELARATERVVDEQALVEILVKGYFLCRNFAKGVEFEWDAFLDETHNPAWTLTRAVAVAEQRTRAAKPGATDAQVLRIAAMQYHQYRQILRGDTGEFLPTAMIKFATGLAKWYLDEREQPALDRVIRALLGSCLASVGIGARHSSSTISK
ncbi:MAG: arginine--tRNA ligase [Planctomycetes bacterium]|nr:arginine--tRNA ligase [Planctomycetota bacterium]